MDFRRDPGIHSPTEVAIEIAPIKCGYDDHVSRSIYPLRVGGVRLVSLRPLSEISYHNGRAYNDLLSIMPSPSYCMSLEYRYSSSPLTICFLLSDLFNANNFRGFISPWESPRQNSEQVLQSI